MLSKEFIKERRAFRLAHTANHLNRVIQTSVTHHITYRPASPRFWIPRTKHEPRDARQNNRARAHGARFQRDSQSATIKAPCAQRSSGLPHCKQLSMRGGVIIGLAGVEPGTNNFAPRI